MWSSRNVFSQRLIGNNFHLNSTSRINSESNISLGIIIKKNLLKSPRFYGNISLLFLSLLTLVCYLFLSLLPLLLWKPVQVWFLQLQPSLSNLRCKFFLVPPLCSLSSSVLGMGTSVLVRDWRCSSHPQTEPCNNSAFLQHSQNCSCTSPVVDELQAGQWEKGMWKEWIAILTETMIKPQSHC